MKILRCPRCYHGLPAELVRSGGGEAKCAACNTDVALRIYTKAITQQNSPTTLPEPAEEGEASCFYNPEHKASAVCSECGVFMSDLHTAKWGEDTVCLKCLANNRDAGTVKGDADGRFESGRFLWDNVALALALFPILLPFLWFFSFISAPTALVLALLKWGKPRSLIPRSRWRLIVAILLAIAQIVGWIVLFIAVIAAEGGDA